MKRVLPAHWRARAASTTDDEKLADNAVGSRAKGLELDLHLREFEIAQLTQRNNFFMIFQGVLIAGLVQSQGTAAPLITFSMSMLGVVTAGLQIGMAGGAKYWQSRWEASTRSSEIALVIELLKRKKQTVQTFTHDSSLLTKEEQAQIEDWNREHSGPEERITDDPDFIQSIVLADIRGSRKKRVRWIADWWVRKFAIAPKWSVSRIPIWIGVFILFFWVVIGLNTVRFQAIDLNPITPDWVELVPLKSELKKE